ncbi:MAG: alpha/beta hydrolase [Pseudomonadales bacterium]|nr:alpha/beta hydrolase [Pseudomonadales bacterium]
MMEGYRRFEFDGANCRLSAVETGDADAPDMVILHGMRDHALSLAGIASEFGNDFHIVMPDLRGHGYSENPGSYSMTQFVADLRSLVTTCELENPVLIGHSLGGHMVSKYTAIYDDVSKLVLIDGMGPPRPPGKPDREQRRGQWRGNIETALQLSSHRKQMADAAEAFERLTRNNPLLSHDLAHLIIDHGVEPHPDGGVRWRWDPAVSMVWSTFSHEESEEQWTWIECPVLVATGEKSMEYWSGPRFELDEDNELHTAEIERRCNLFVDARHREIPDAGHMLHYDQPEALNRCLREFIET